MNLSTFSLLKNHKGSVVIDAELTQKIQKVLLSIIIDFDQCCRENNINYSLCGGSALGAVRHKGFIPWDDDIDVFMPRRDYNKFLKIYKNFLGDKYTLHAPETTPELGMPIAQLSLNGTVYKTQLAPSRENPGIYIDIFILENIPDNVLLRYIHGIGSLFFGLALSCTRYNTDKNVLLSFYSNANKNVLNTLKTKIELGYLFKIIFTLSTWCKLNNWWNGLCQDMNVRDVSCPSDTKHYFGEIFNADLVCKTHDTLFESAKLKLMDSYEAYLTQAYGSDYMTPPPRDKREVHSIIELKL